MSGSRFVSSGHEEYTRVSYTLQYQQGAIMAGAPQGGGWDGWILQTQERMGFVLVSGDVF